MFCKLFFSSVLLTQKQFDISFQESRWYGINAIDKIGVKITKTKRNIMLAINERWWRLPTNTQYFFNYVRSSSRGIVVMWMMNWKRNVFFFSEEKKVEGHVCNIRVYRWWRFVSCFNHVSVQCNRNNFHRNKSLLPQGDVPHYGVMISSLEWQTMYNFPSTLTLTDKQFFQEDGQIMLSNINSSYMTFNIKCYFGLVPI